MNALSLSVFSTICAGTLTAQGPDVLAFAPNRSCPANDHVLRVAISSDRLLITDTTPHFPRCLASGSRTINLVTMIGSFQQES